MVSSFADVPTEMGILWPAKSGSHGHQPTLLTSDHAHLFSYDIHMPIYFFELIL